MAGIAGISKRGQEEWVRRALQTISHRGGAGGSALNAASATIGQVWPQAQCGFAAGAGRTSAVLDGEIYNWHDLSVGGTCALEAVQHAYGEKGPRFAAEIDGPFALAIAAGEGLFLARDRVGKSPLYYGKNGDGSVCFASELKCLVGWDGAVAEFPPGHYYTPREGLVRFGGIEPQAPMERPAEEIAEELRGRIVASVMKRVSAGEIGAWLSGGIDSAGLTAVARRQLPALKTFAAGVEGAPDLRYARLVSEFCGTDHRERLVTLTEMLAVLPTVIYHLESFDALLVRSSITNYLVGRLAAEHVPAVLSGEGGDELFGGYAYLKDLPPSELPEELVDITRRLHNTALQRVDRCSASHGLVARTAYLDQEVLDFALRIPPHMKVHENGGGRNGKVEKWILRRALDGLLPEEVLTRTKAKFWQGAGVRELIQGHAEEMTSDSEFVAEREVGDGILINTKEELYYYRIFRDLFGQDVDAALVGRTKGAPVVDTGGTRSR